MKALFKRWMFAQMYGKKLNFFQRLGVWYFLTVYRGFPSAVSWYQANNPTRLS